MALDQRHHEALLQARLDELFLAGHCFINWSELYHWFNVDKISKTPYRKINEMWQELFERRGTEPVAVRKRDGSGGFHLFRDPVEGVDGEETALASLI